jgi:hypothetical protein
MERQYEVHAEMPDGVVRDMTWEQFADLLAVMGRNTADACRIGGEWELDQAGAVSIAVRISVRG